MTGRLTEMLTRWRGWSDRYFSLWKDTRERLLLKLGNRETPVSLGVPLKQIYALLAFV